ncbi:MAG: hypothetical protein U0T69_11460 [Chitinophagales bacterium]
MSSTKPVNGWVLTRPLLNREIIIQTGDNPYHIFDDCVNAEVLTDGVLLKKGDIIQFHKQMQTAIVQNFLVFNRYELPEFDCDFMFLVEEIPMALGGMYGYYRGIESTDSNDLRAIPNSFKHFNVFDGINLVELDVNVKKTNDERERILGEIRKSKILDPKGKKIHDNKYKGISLFGIKAFDRIGTVLKGKFAGERVIIHKHTNLTVKIGDKVVAVVDDEDLAFIVE